MAEKKEIHTFLEGICVIVNVTNSTGIRPWHADFSLQTASHAFSFK